MSAEVNFHGVEDLSRRLKILANIKTAKRVARKSARQAMNIVRDAARANAKAIDDPETAEKIWKNIAVSGGKSRNANEIVMRVGVRGGASFSNKNPPKVSGGDTRHFRWVEFGSANNPPTPFLRPALSNNISRVTNQFATSFNQEIEKELAKL